MSKELFVRGEDNFKRVSYFAKELLKESSELKVVSSHVGSSVVAKVCNFLAEKGFVTITNVETKTEVKYEKRRLNFVMTLTKTPEFDNLYAEYQKLKEELIKKREAENAEKH